MQEISDEYLTSRFTIKPGDRLHRLVAMLMDTYYDDLTGDCINELIEHIERFRWMNAAGRRLDI